MTVEIYLDELPTLVKIVTGANCRPMTRRNGACQRSYGSARHFFWWGVGVAFQGRVGISFGIHKLRVGQHIAAAVIGEHDQSGDGGVPLLRFRPRQRIKNFKLGFFTRQPPRSFQSCPDFLRHGLDFIPRRGDQQHGFIFRHYFHIRFGDDGMKFVLGKFGDCAHAFQLCERFHRVFLRRELYRLAIPLSPRNFHLDPPPGSGILLVGFRAGMLFHQENQPNNFLIHEHIFGAAFVRQFAW